MDIIWNFGGAISYILGLLFKVKVQNWKMFLGLPDISYTSGVKSRCWVQAYVFRKLKVTPWGQALLPPELLYNLAKHAYSKRTDTARQTVVGKWTDEYAGRQTARSCCSQPSERWICALTT